jgi:hypothetical protein
MAYELVIVNLARYVLTKLSSKHAQSMCKFHTYAGKYTFLQGYPGSLSLHLDSLLKVHYENLWVSNLCGEIYNPSGTLKSSSSHFPRHHPHILPFIFRKTSSMDKWIGISEQKQFICSNMVVYAKSYIQFRQKYQA